MTTTPRTPTTDETRRYVTLVTAWVGPTIGYVGALVEELDDPEVLPEERELEVLRMGPPRIWSDALLVADVLAARWAEEIGERYEG